MFQLSCGNCLLPTKAQMRACPFEQDEEAEGKHVSTFVWELPFADDEMFP